MALAAVMRGTGAATSDSHPYSLQVDGLDVAKQPGTPGGLFGTNVDSVVITERIGAIPTMDFVVDDPAKALTIRAGANVYFADHRGRKLYPSLAWATEDLFRGIVQSARLASDGGIARRWEVRAVGLASLLDDRVLTGGVIPGVEGVEPVLVPALQQVLSEVDPRISALQSDPLATSVRRDGALGGDLFMDAGGSFLVPTPLASRTRKRAVDDLVEHSNIASALAFWRADEVDVDMQGRARVNPNVGNLPYAIIKEGTGALVAPYATRPAPAAISVDSDSAQLVNAVYVRGVDAASSGWVTDDVSIATYGRRERYIEAPASVSSATVTNIGQTYLNGAGIKTRVRMTLEGAHDLLIPDPTDDRTGGWHVRCFASLFTSTGYWNSGDFFMTEEVQRTFDGGGTNCTIVLGFSSGAPVGGLALAGAIADVSETSRAAARLVGTLGEVAIRGKAGTPTDDDFDVPRDGFMVVDTSSERLWIRANGTWQPMAGSTGVRARHSANQNIGSGAAIVAALNAERFDTDGFHDTVTNNSRLTVPPGMGGAYVIGYTVELGSVADAGQMFAEVYLNGATILSAQAQDVAAGRTVLMTGATEYRLVDGDYVELRLVNAVTANTRVLNSTGNYSPEFWMFRVGP